MKKITKQSSNTIIVLSIIALLFSLSSCTAIKSTDSNKFTRVKYNPHIKLKKSVDRTTVKVHKVEPLIAHEPSVLKEKKNEERTVRQPLFKPFSKKENGELLAKKSVVSVSNNVSLFSLFNPALNNTKSNNFFNDWNHLLPTVNATLEPMASDSDMESLVWIILAVLLVLLLLSILAELGGGLIGALLAVLLILLILRLLGIV